MAEAPIYRRVMLKLSGGAFAAEGGAGLDADRVSFVAREVADACSPFDPLWETLTAREQARVLHVLIERVDYDGPKGTVSISFHPTGIKTLANELAEEVTA